MTKEHSYRIAKEPFARVSSGRNLAFVAGDDVLVKTACLYFEHVITTSRFVSEDTASELTELNHKGIRFAEVLPGEPCLAYDLGPDDGRAPEDLQESEGTPAWRHVLFPSRYGLGDDMRPSREGMASFSVLITERLDENGVSHAHMLVPPNHEIRDIAYVKRYSVSNSTYLDEAPDERPGIVLSNLDIVDVSNASWQQITEVRNDRSFIRSMRDIRLFVRDNFEGRSLAYVEDRLGSLIDAQNTKARHHGLDITHGVLWDLLNARDLHAVGGASLAMLLLDVDPVLDSLALAATGATAALGVGKIALSISKARLDYRSTTFDDPASYLIGLKDKLGRDGP